jgi:uncharacterized OB-fold protein
MTLNTQAVGDVPQCPSCGQYLYSGPHYCPQAQSAAVMHVQSGALDWSQAGEVRAALVRIAADHETTAGGHRRRLSRAEQTTLAREVCLSMGWEWSRP